MDSESYKNALSVFEKTTNETDCKQAFCGLLQGAESPPIRHAIGEAYASYIRYLTDSPSNKYNPYP